MLSCFSISELEASAVVKSMGPSAVVAPLADGSEEIPISSIVVAAKSRVLRTMLSNGMKESDVRTPVVLKVTEEGEKEHESPARFTSVSLMFPPFSLKPESPSLSPIKRAFGALAVCFLWHEFP